MDFAAELSLFYGGHDAFPNRSASYTTMDTDVIGGLE